MKRYRITIYCRILIIKKLHDATSHATFYYDYVHFLQIVPIYEINRCLTWLISEKAISIGSFSRWGGNDDEVQGYQINKHLAEHSP